MLETRQTSFPALSVYSKVGISWSTSESDVTVKILKIGTPEIITIIVLQLEQLDFYSAVLCSKAADRITNREDPDQTAP